MVDKTTLASQLSEYLNCEYIHSPGNVDITQMKDYINNFINYDGLIITDRFPIIEEEVYGNLLRDGSRFKSEPDYINQSLSKVDLFIYCYPGLFNMLNWGDREQYPGIKENALEMINSYNKIAVNLKKSGYNIKEYNYNYNNYKELID